MTTHERTGPPRRRGRPPGPRRDRDERRAELLDGAERAIRRIGPHVSMDELAAEAGITKPILYAHFGDKAGLSNALAARVASRLNGEIRASLAQELPPSLVIRSTVEAFCTFIDDEPELYRFLVQTAAQRPRRSPSKLVTNVATEIAEVLGAALRAAGADPEPAEVWSYAIVGLMISSAGWWVERRAMGKDDLVDHLSGLLWRGLGGSGLDRLEPER